MWMKNRDGNFMLFRGTVLNACNPPETIISYGYISRQSRDGKCSAGINGDKFMPV